MEQYKNYINGQFRDAKNTFFSINPTTEEPWAKFSAANAKDVDDAVQSAVKAFNSDWSKSLPQQRIKVLRSIGDKLIENAELLGIVETKDTGKMLKETRFQAKYIAEYYYYYAGLVDKIEGSTLPIDKPDMQVFTTRVTIGVVAAIIPWNAQMVLTAVK